MEGFRVLVPKPCSPPPPQSPQSRDYTTTHNQNNHGVIGNGSSIVNSGNNNQVIIINVTNAKEEDVELDRLLDGSISKDALHNTFTAPLECHPGTRKTILKQFGEWFNNKSPAKSPLLWLHGPAGVGKSVIAKTIAVSHQVVASFFFSTSSDRSTATLFPTLAWQLARKIPETKQHIIASLKNNGSLLTSEIKEQFDHLIAQPLKECKMTFTFLPVMVIDGIDECTNEYALSRFLQVLVCAAESGDMPLRFIICSRPEPRIRAVLKKINDHQETNLPGDAHSHQPRPRFDWLPRIHIQLLLPDIRNQLYIPIIWAFRNPTLLLQDVWKLYRPMSPSGDTGEPPPDKRDHLFDRISPDPLVSEIKIGFSQESKEDIAKYLTDKFNEMGSRLGESDISQLVERSCGQFLYASTIVRLLSNTDPREVLDMARCSVLPTPDLNKLYKIILERAKDAIRIRAQEGGPDELRILLDTLGILVVFAENVHFFNVQENFLAIESLISIEKGRLTKKLYEMHSVLNIVDGVSISVHHRSFLEFLQSQKCSGEHYVAYPKALRRFLVLLIRAGLKYFVMDWCGQLDDGRKMREDLGNLVLSCRRNYFKRSRSPATMTALHDLIHYFLPFIYLVPFYQFTRQLKESFFISTPPSSSVFVFILEYPFLAFFCFLILSSGSFVLSLTIYTLLFNLSLILPLFHPFLHLHFVTIVGILLSSTQVPSLDRTYSQANNAVMADDCTTGNATSGITSGSLHKSDDIKKMNKKEVERLQIEADSEKERLELLARAQGEQARAVTQDRKHMMAKTPSNVSEWVDGASKSSEQAYGSNRKSTTSTTVNAAAGRYGHQPADDNNDITDGERDQTSSELLPKARRRDFDDDHLMSSSDLHSFDRLSTVDSDPALPRNRPSLFGMNRMSSIDSLDASFDGFPSSASSSTSYSLDGEIARYFRIQAAVNPSTTQGILSPSVYPTSSPHSPWLSLQSPSDGHKSSTHTLHPHLEYGDGHFHQPSYGQSDSTPESSKSAINFIFKLLPLILPSLDLSASCITLPPFSKFAAIVEGKSSPVFPISFSPLSPAWT